MTSSGRPPPQKLTSRRSALAIAALLSHSSERTSGFIRCNSTERKRYRTKRTSRRGRPVFRRVRCGKDAHDLRTEDATHVETRTTHLHLSLEPRVLS